MNIDRRVDWGGAVVLLSPPWVFQRDGRTPCELYAKVKIRCGG